MTASIDFGAAITKWAESEPTVKALVLIGSRERPNSDRIAQSDGYSDWDFHIITSQPEMFSDRQWTRDLRGVDVVAYAVRRAAIGGVPKINAIFCGAEVDFVIFPEKMARALRFKTALNLYRREGWTRQRLMDLALVIRPGWRFLKGSKKWGPLYKTAVISVEDQRLTDRSVLQLGETFYCDYMWTLRKIQRGELHAAQRTLFRELLETNYKLFHELQLRRKQLSFHEARRLEWTANAEEIDALTIGGILTQEGLHTELEHCATTCRRLINELVGESWHWPQEA